jgi:diacylglycerol kinase (ATP)
MKAGKFSFKSRLASFRFALNGFWSLLKFEHNSRIHLVCAVAAIILGIILKLNSSEWSLIILLIGIVFITELLNSAVESLADYIKPEWNEMIKKTKDYCAAAVLISAIISVIIGAIIFIPKISDLIFTSSVLK